MFKKILKGLGISILFLALYGWLFVDSFDSYDSLGGLGEIMQALLFLVAAIVALISAILIGLWLFKMGRAGLRYLRGKSDWDEGMDV